MSSLVVSSLDPDFAVDDLCSSERRWVLVPLEAVSCTTRLPFACRTLKAVVASSNATETCGCTGSVDCIIGRRFTVFSQWFSSFDMCEHQMATHFTYHLVLEHIIWCSHIFDIYEHHNRLWACGSVSHKFWLTGSADMRWKSSPLCRLNTISFVSETGQTLSIFWLGSRTWWRYGHENWAHPSLRRFVTRSGCDQQPMCGGPVRSHCLYLCLGHSALCYRLGWCLRVNATLEKAFTYYAACRDVGYRCGFAWSRN